MTHKGNLRQSQSKTESNRMPTDQLKISGLTKNHDTTQILYIILMGLNKAGPVSPIQIFSFS